MPRTVLIMTYEFPPAGGGGVQRVTKFCRYLAEFGWEPVVVTAELVPGRPTDPSLAEEVAGVRVVRTPARHVATAISQLIAPLKRAREASAAAGAGASAGAATESGLAKASLSRRLARWIAIPDDAAYWKGPAVRAAIRLGRETGAEAVVASGPPFSVLVAGRAVADALGVPFVADLRDAWDTNPTLIQPTGWHRERSRALERSALRGADRVITAAPPAAAEAVEFGATEVQVLPNGFDTEDLPTHEPADESRLRLNFMGKVYAGLTDPTPVVSAIERLAASGSDIAFDVVGSWPPAFEAAIASSPVAEKVRLHGYRPHREALDIAATADVGVAIVADVPGADGSTPAKVFEYLAMGMPVLLIAPPTGFAAEVVRETGGGAIVAPGDADALDAELGHLAGLKAAGQLTGPDRTAVARFGRRTQTGELASILDDVTARAAAAKEAVA